MSDATGVAGFSTTSMGASASSKCPMIDERTASSSIASSTADNSACNERECECISRMLCSLMCDVSLDVSPSCSPSSFNESACAMAARVRS